MKTIATLGVAASIQLGNAIRSYAKQLREDAALYRSQHTEILAVETTKTALELEALADSIDCGPIKIIGIE